MSTAVVENKLYEMIMSLSLPSHTLISLGKKLSEAAVISLPVAKTASRENILSECCGAWENDARSTEEIISGARSAFKTNIIRNTESE